MIRPSLVPYFGASDRDTSPRSQEVGSDSVMVCRELSEALAEVA
jgi:hypothetical protein